MEDAFESPKKMPTLPPIFAFTYFEAPIIVETDASNVTLGTVLARRKEYVKPHPVYSASQKL